MGCQRSLDFETTGGAHLSFYWTMDEAGSANKVDSTVGLVWPLQWSAVATTGLFSNGLHAIPGTILNQHPGVGIFGTASITINQVTSTGISVWFWVKKLAAGVGGLQFSLDTSDVMHTNRFRFTSGNLDGTPGSGFEINHTNDTDDVFVDTPDLNWNVGDWHMVVGTYDKTAQTLNMYIDGVISATIPDAFTYPNLTNSDMFLVNLSHLTALDFAIDECGLSTKGALSQAQITSLYNGSIGVTWPNITPIVPYP